MNSVHVSQNKAAKIILEFTSKPSNVNALALLSRESPAERRNLHRRSFIIYSIMSISHKRLNELHNYSYQRKANFRLHSFTIKNEVRGD